MLRRDPMKDVGSPFSAGKQPNWVAVDPSGKFAYVANAGSDTVSGYAINPFTGALTPIVS
jgi:6-phosphogluconolactonase